MERTRERTRMVKYSVRDDDTILHLGLVIESHYSHFMIYRRPFKADISIPDLLLSIAHVAGPV